MARSWDYDKISLVMPRRLKSSRYFKTFKNEAMIKSDIGERIIYLHDTESPVGKSVQIAWGENEICETLKDAIAAAEILKAYFEAKQQDKHVDLIIDGATPSALIWQDGYSAAKPETDPLIIAQLAAEIFAHNPHDFDERRAVESAAKIIELSRNHEK